MLSAGTTCCIAAAKALQHLEDNLAAITNIFSTYQITPSDYRLLAGFDEDLIKGSTGHLEQIHVLLYSEPRHIKSMLRKLESIFSPFSAVIFTKGAVHHIPSTITGFGKINWDNTSDLLITRRMPDRRRYPTAVSLSHITKEQASPNSNQAEGGREPDSPGASPVEISFLATSDLHPLPKQPQEPHSKCPYQSLTTKGTFVITRTPESQQHPQRFATCQVLFTELGTGTVRSAGDLAYAHIHTVVIIDSQQELAYIRDIKPQRMMRFSGDTKLCHKKFLPQGSSHATRMPECSTSPETTFISSMGMDGLGIWCYDIIDGFFQVGEKVMASDKLPQAQFDFIGKTDTPAPPPERIDVEVATYWSVLPCNSGSENSLWNRPTGFWSNKPSYSNIYQLVALKVPSDVPRERYDFQARHTVFPQLSNISKTGYNDNPTDMAHSAVLDSKLGFDTASSVYDVRRRDKIIQLTSFRKVRVPPMATCEVQPTA